jgi:hypothetical protein
VDTSRLENRDSDQIERRQDMTTISRMTPTIPRRKIIGQANWRPAVEAFLDRRRRLRRPAVTFHLD